MSKQTIDVTIKNLSVNLSEKQRADLDVCEKFYSKMRKMGLSRKEEFNSYVLPASQERPKQLTYCAGDVSFLS